MIHCSFVFSCHQGTPLHVAARKGHVDTVRCLVEKGAKVSIQDKAGVNIPINRHLRLLNFVLRDPNVFGCVNKAIIVVYI